MNNSNDKAQSHWWEGITKTAGEFTEAEWKKYKEEHPGAKKENHTITKSKSDGGGGSGGADVPKGVDLSGVTPEQVAEFSGEIPEYKIEIIAGGEDGEITEADLRRAKAVKAQLQRGIQAAADICKMSPPVCEGNFGVARSSMPQLSADEPIKDMLKSDEQRIKDMGDKWDDLSDEKKAKKKKDWATARKKGQAAVDAGADPDDDRTVFQQLLDSVAEEGVNISSQEPPFDQRPVGELKATQREIKAGKTYGIANAYLQGDYDPREAPIIISSDNHILDGHHRYSAMITADPDAKMNVVVVDMPMKKFLERSFEQPGVFRADLQDNIISNDEPLDLARQPGSSWQQSGKWYAKNEEGESSGPFKDKDGAEAYAKGEKKEEDDKKKDDKKKDDKPKKKASRRTQHSKGIERLSDRDLRKLFHDLLKFDKVMEQWNRSGPMWGGPHLDDWAAFHAEAKKRGIKLASDKKKATSKFASRYHLPGKRPGSYVAFGIDRPFGWFFQYWEDDADEPTVDKSMRLSQGDLTVLLRKYAKPGSDLNKSIDAIVLDLEPSQMGVRDLNRRASKPTLKGRLAKLAFDNPDMREALLPLLKD